MEPQATHTTCTATASASEHRAPSCTFVKWKTPADEVMGLAAFAAKAIERGEVQPRRLAFAVAGRNWGAQLERACKHVGLRTSFCVTTPQLDQGAALALAKLAYIADPASRTARNQLIAFGLDDAAQAQLIDQCARLGGFTLAHRLGIDSAPALSHGMLHVSGTENAPALLETLQAQLAQPTMPGDLQLSPIMDYRTLTGTFDWVIIVGCVNGLIPSAHTLGSADTRNETALTAQRDAFRRAQELARERTVLSSFAKAEANLAAAAHLCCARTKTEQGQRICLCTPTCFIDEMEAHRPSTIGGQALLREYGIN